MGGMTRGRGGKKGRKVGRNAVKCAAYARSGKLERRKIRNLMRCCGMTRERATRVWQKGKADA